MQRVAWNDSLDFLGSTRRGSRGSRNSNGSVNDRASVCSDGSNGRRDGDVVRPSAARHHPSQTSQTGAHGSHGPKSLGRVAAKAFIKRGRSRNDLQSRGATPTWESLEDHASFSDVLNSQMSFILQVLEDTQKKLIRINDESEQRMNELRAENKLLRVHVQGTSNGGTAHFYSRRSKAASKCASAAPSAGQSVAPSIAPSVCQSARSSVVSQLPIIERSSSMKSMKNSLESDEFTKRGSLDSATVAKSEKVPEKVDKVLSTSQSFTAVTPLPPPSRGQNGCWKLEVDYEEDKDFDSVRHFHSVRSRTSRTSTETEDDIPEIRINSIISSDEDIAEGEEDDKFDTEDDASTNSDLSNGMFETLPIWMQESTGTISMKPATKTLGNNKQKNFKRISKLRDLTFKFTDILEEENRQTKYSLYVERFIVHPSSGKRGIWDLVSIVLVVYDLVVIPLALFEPEETWPLVVMTWVCRIFWTVDMPLSFLTGFIRNDGSLEMRPAKIARRYFQTWFALDFFLITVDWLETGWSNGFGYARLGKSSRVFRVLRLVRLLRMLRMKDVIKVAMERMHSERLWIFSDILKIMVLVVGMAHIIACIWYGIGTQSDKEHSWVKAHLASPIYTDLGSRYAMSLHWSLSQFTGGMDEMRPHTVGERVYAIIIYIFTFIVAAVFVSSLTSSMTRLHFIASHQSKQFFQLRRYLFQNNISDELTLRIQRNAQHAVTEQQLFMQESSVDLLDIVSEPLRIDLHFELYAPIYHLHPFFDRYAQDCPQVMRKVCHRATSMTLASCGDTMFDAGEIPAHPKMIFVCSGQMQYVSISGTETQVKAVIWISEAVLWTPWMHLGVLTATAECRLIVLDSQKFHHIVSQYDHADLDPRTYAQNFVGQLNATTEEITDLPLKDNYKIRNHSRIQNRRLTIQFNKTL